MIKRLISWHTKRFGFKHWLDWLVWFFKLLYLVLPILAVYFYFRYQSVWFMAACTGGLLAKAWIEYIEGTYHDGYVAGLKMARIQIIQDMLETLIKQIKREHAKGIN